MARDEITDVMSRTFSISNMRDVTHVNVVSYYSISICIFYTTNNYTYLKKSVKSFGAHCTIYLHKYIVLLI